MTLSRLRPQRRRAGFTQLELLVVVAILGTVAALGIPRLLHWSASLRVQLAADECVVALRRARLLAISRSGRVGLKFRQQGGRYSYTLYQDGDGDGLLTSDIDSGVDPRLSPPRMLAHMGGDVRFGFPADVVPSDPSDPGRPLDRLDDPIRFNRSDIASFSPLGESTPGSLYIAGRDHLVVVRLLGRTGKVRVLTYDRVADRWVQH